MKIFRFILIFSYLGLFPFLLYSQEWLQSSILQSNNNIEIEEIIKDQNSNLYVAGQFKGTIENLSENISSHDDKPDIFIAKYNASLERVWIKNIGGPSFDYRPELSIYQDTLMITGSFANSVYFTESDFLESLGILDVFVAKYTLDGNFQNAELLYWGPNYQYTQNIKILNNEEYLIAGHFYDDSVNIRNDTILRTEENTYHPFFSKHKISSHEVVWAKYYKNSNSNTRYTNIAHYENSIFLNGYFRESFYLDLKTITSKKNSRDLFLYSIDQNGNGQWLRRTYGSSNDATATMTYDDYGNLFFGGYYRSNDFVVDSTANLISDTSHNRGNTDLFLQKFNRSGNLLWKKDYGSPGKEWTKSIKEQNGMVYIGGYYSDSLVFGEETLKTSGVDDYGILLGAFDTDGNMIKGEGVNGEGGNDVANAITIDNQNNAYLAGYFDSENIQFGDDSYTNPNPGTQVAFIAKYATPFNATFTKKQNISCPGGGDGKLTVTPYFGVPSYNYEWVHEEDTLSITDSAATELSAGAYTVIVTDSLGSTDTISTTLTEPDPFNFNGYIEVGGAITDSLNCFSDSTAEIHIDPQGGTTPYSFTWTTSGDGYISDDVRYDSIQFNRPRGTYHLEVEDNNACVYDTSFTVKAPDPVTFNGTTVQHIGNSQDGSINLAVSGGTGDAVNFGYFWDGPDPALPADTTQDLTGLINRGNYTVDATDENGCTFDTSVYVMDTSEIYISFHSENIQHVSCHGDSSGEAAVSVYEYEGPLSYTWKDNEGTTLSETDSTLSGYPAGKYFVTVMDDGHPNDTTLTDSVTIEQPNPIDLNVSSNSTPLLDCYGDSTGVIEILAGGGTKPLTYSWADGASGDYRNDLPADTYTVTVTDDNGCSRDTSYTINQPEQLTASIDIYKKISCYGSSDGELEAKYTGGTGPNYFYEWNDGAHQTSKIADGLNAGAYQVTVTDDNGCTATASHDFSQPDSLSITANISDVTCFGGSNGSIQLDSVGGGTPSYTYWWSTDSGSGLVETDRHQSSLTAADYTVELTDANSCTKEKTYTVNQPAEVTINSMDSTDVTCNGGSNGEIVVQDVSGGSGTGYEYSNNGGSDWQSSNTFSGLTAGSYDIQARDDQGCTSSIKTVTIEEPDAISFTITSSDVTCNGGNDGELVVENVTGGSGTGYEYSIDTGKTWQTSATFSSLTAGIYAIQVRDSRNCTSNATVVTINEPDPLDASISVTDISCFGRNDGEIDITSATGGSGSYQYSTDSGATWQDNGTYTGLSDGVYGVYIRDANNTSCTATLNDSVVLDEPAPLTVSDSVTDVTCYGGSNGSVDITVSGGTGSYTYNWSNGETTEDISSLTAGDYSVTVTDANSCTKEQTYTVNQPAEVTINSMDSTDVTCNGGSDGEIIVQDVSGGSGSDYEYSSNGGSDWQSSNTFSGLTAGSYDIQVRDSRNCTSEATVVTINEPDPLDASISVTDISCFGENDGEIDITSATGGSGSYQYSIDSGDTWQENGTYTGLSAGVYGVYIRDANHTSCSKILNNSVTLSQPSAMNVDGIITDVTCHGGSNGSVDITVSGGSGSYTYNWSNGETTEDINSLTAGDYSLTVTDANSCTKEQSYTVNQPAEVMINSMDSTDVTCNGDSDGEIVVQDVSGGSGTGYEYSSNGGSDWQSSNTFSGLTAGSYDIQARDDQGCTSSIKTVTIEEPDAITLTAASSDVTCNGGSDGSIDLTVSGGIRPYSYSWSDESTTEDISNLSAGDYSVTVTDSAGCTAEATYTIDEPTALSVSGTVSDVTCNGGSDGSIDLSVTGGTTPYSYTWSDGSTTEDISNLAAGDYSVTVTDSRSCGLISKDYTVNQPAEIIIDTGNIEVNDVSEPGASDGSISLDASGGTAPLTYILNPDSLMTNETGEFSGLSSGKYVVLVTDANQCGPKHTDSLEVESAASAVGDMISQYNMKFYPNPAKDNLHLEMSLDSRTSVRLEFINATGQTVEERKFTRVNGLLNRSLDVSSLQQGIYFVRFYIGGEYSGNTSVVVE